MMYYMGTAATIPCWAEMAMMSFTATRMTILLKGMLATIPYMVAREMIQYSETSTALETT